MEKLVELDKAIFFFLNGLHSPWLDFPMFMVSHTVTWLPLYAVLLYLLIRHYGKQCWIPLIGVALTILFADQITSGIMKPLFERLRPTRDPALEGLVHYVNNRGGLYGFASSHAANTFGTATFFFFMFRNTRRKIWMLFLWAAFVSYTRIYLGLHYPGDILVGALVGVFSGWICFRFTETIQRKFVEYRESHRS